MFKVTLIGKEKFSTAGHGTIFNGVSREVDEKTYLYLEKTFPSLFDFEKEVVEVPKKVTSSRKKKVKVEEDS